jgi:hypothetical protein
VIVLGTLVGEGMADIRHTRERLESWYIGDCGVVIATGRNHNLLESLLAGVGAHDPTMIIVATEFAHRCLQPDMPGEIELLRVALKIFTHCLACRISRWADIVRKFAEAGGDATGVSTHGWSDTAMAGIGAPLTTDMRALLEDNRLEALRF